MIYSVDELRRRIRPFAEKYRIPAVYLFGSYARGEAHEGSDVDVLIDRGGSAINSLLDLCALQYDLNCDLKKEIDIVTEQQLQQPEAREESPWFLKNVYEERVQIYGIP